MRLVAAVFVLLATALPVNAQIDTPAAQPGASHPAKPAASTSKFRRPAARAAVVRAQALRTQAFRAQALHAQALHAQALRAHAAARRAQIAGQAANPAVAGDGSSRIAAAARKKGPTPPPGPSRDSLPLADRIAIQFDLAWTGDYNGLINGEWTDKTIAAIKTFQRNRKFKETGVLNTQERALLAASSKAKQAQVGWTMVDDSVTGVRLGLPSKHVPNKTPSKTGTRWTSAQGQVQVETFMVREPGTTLASVYEQQKKEPSTRKLEVNFVKGDFFILSGMQNLKKFYVRAHFKDGEVRGMTILYDQATENPMDAVTVAMSGAFTPFPGVVGVAQISPAPKRKVEYGSGIVVSSAGHILTDREVTDGCNVIVASGYGDADRQAEDKSNGLALLRVYGVPDLVAAGFADEAAKGPDVTIVGIADPQAQGGGSAVSTAAAKLRGEMLEPSPQLGFSGAAALDGQGRIVGMVELKSPVVAQVGTGAAQPQATMVDAPAIRAFLEAQKLAPAASRGGIDAAKASLVRVICVRK
jgi:trypsin-like peptidase/putative peptidoglycan binding protein